MTIHPDCRRFLSDSYTTEDGIRAVRDSVGGGVRKPVQLHEFLKPDIAEQLHRLLSASDVWERVAYAYDGDTSQVEIPVDAWDAHATPMSRQWLLRDVGRLLADRSAHVDDVALFKNFLTFAVLGGGLRSWVAAVLEKPLRTQGSLELAAYGHGDEIRPHHDLVGSKIATLNIYLDPDYDISDGGTTTLEPFGRDQSTIAPLYNSASIIPIEEGLYHWVSPWRAERRGRYTINMGQDLACEAGTA